MGGPSRSGEIFGNGLAQSRIEGKGALAAKHAQIQPLARHGDLGASQPKRYVPVAQQGHDIDGGQTIGDDRHRLTHEAAGPRQQQGRPGGVVQLYVEPRQFRTDATGQRLVG